MSRAQPPAGLEEALGLLRRRKADVSERYHVEFVGVVGSLARGQARWDSDIDVVVRQAGKTTLFALTRLESELEAQLGRPVDLVFSEIMKPERRAYIERDLVAL